MNSGGCWSLDEKKWTNSSAGDKPLDETPVANFLRRLPKGQESPFGDFPSDYTRPGDEQKRCRFPEQVVSQTFRKRRASQTYPRLPTFSFDVDMLLSTIGFMSL